MDGFGGYFLFIVCVCLWLNKILNAWLRIDSSNVYGNQLYQLFNEKPQSTGATIKLLQIDW